jgi:hypothetical protein
LNRLHAAYDTNAKTIVGKIMWLKVSAKWAEKPGATLGDRSPIVLKWVHPWRFDQIAASFNKMANQKVGIARKRNPVVVKL